MTIDDKTTIWYQQRTNKRSKLWPGKIDRYEYVTGEEIIASSRRQKIEQATFAYFLW